MAPKKYGRLEGPSSSSLVRPDPPSVVESPRQSSKDDDTILREIIEYTSEPRDDADIVDRIIESDKDKEDIVMSEAADPLTNFARYMGGTVQGYYASIADVSLATMSGDPNRPSFTVNFTAPKTPNWDILRP